jgi:signal transduction histidine kinase
LKHFIYFIRYLIHSITGLFLFFSIPVFAQNVDTAALQQEFQRSKSFNNENQLDSAISILSNISKIAQDNQYWELLTTFKVELARLYEEKEDYDNTLRNYIELIRIFQKNEITDQLALTYFALGQDYEKYKLYNKAIINYSLAGSHFNSYGDDLQMSESYIRQSDLYFTLENYEMADSTLDIAIQILKKYETGKDIIKHLQKQVTINNRIGRIDKVLDNNREILEIYRQYDDHHSAIRTQNEIGYNYAESGNYKMALSILLESLEASAKFNVHDSIRINILTNIGITYSALDMNSISIDTLIKVESYYKKNDRVGKLARTQDLIAEVYLKQGEIPDALNFSERSVQNALSYGDLSILRDCYKTLSDIYQESDDFKNALKYYGLYSELNDSISVLSITKQNQLYLLEQTNTDRERKMIRMVLDEELEELALENYMIQMEKYQKEIELYRTEKALEKEAQKRRYLILVFIFLACLLILIVIGYISKQKDNRLLKQQKESILNINKELKTKNDAVESGIKKLKDTQSKLVESEKMASLGQLTAGVAHEINNPVNFISSNIKPLKLSISEIMEILNEYRKLNDTESKESNIQKAKELEEKYDIEYLIKELNTILAGINDGAERTKEIVLGLRNFSRLDKHQLKEIKLPEVIDSNLVLLRNQYKDRIEIQKSYDENIPCIQCYPGQLSQVIMNILNNAIQAIDGKGTISVKTRLSGKEAQILISDTGKGIPNDKLDNIFDPFYTTKEVGKGTGLGLSISYGIIQEHNGKIDVNSELEKGTTFTITLPLRQKE